MLTGRDRSYMRQVPFARVGWRKHTRRQPSVLSLSREEEKLVASRIARTLGNGAETMDGVPFRGLTLYASVRIKKESRTVETGVEFLGKRETFIETTSRITELSIGPAYDEDGNRTPVEADVWRIREATNEILERNPY